MRQIDLNFSRVDLFKCFEIRELFLAPLEEILRAI
jgi:hypothetical protein